VSELRRAELSLAALGLTAVLLAVVVAVDVVHFHGVALDPHVALGVVDAVVIARALSSLTRQVRAQRAFTRRLPVIGSALIDGYPVRIVAGRQGAFCAGLLGPAVYIAEGTLREMRVEELRAILAHEEHHRRRRDPLRQLSARVVSDALAPLPPFASLAAREETIAELSADAASVAALGDPKPLAAALVRFDEGDAGVAPERVDRLVGNARAITIPSALLFAAGTALAGIAGLVVTTLLADWHMHLIVLAAACVPASFAACRATSGVRPAA
jgi:Zn-dependent protease with chaperone function